MKSCLKCKFTWKDSDNYKCSQLISREYDDGFADGEDPISSTAGEIISDCISMLPRKTNTLAHAVLDCLDNGNSGITGLDMIEENFYKAAEQIVMFWRGYDKEIEDVILKSKK